MRIKLIGQCDSVASLRGKISRAGYLITDFRPDYTIELGEHDAASILFDSVDCELEQRIFRHVRTLTLSHVAIQTAGGVQSDKKIHILIPARDEDRYAVEVGVVRGLMEVVRHKPARSLWSRLKLWK